MDHWRISSDGLLLRHWHRGIGADAATARRRAGGTTAWCGHGDLYFPLSNIFGPGVTVVVKIITRMISLNSREVR